MFLFTTDLSAVDTPSGLFWCLVLGFGILGIGALLHKWASK